MSLLIVRGLPGSGKSTFANVYYPDWLHIERDMFYMKFGIYQYDNAKFSQASEWCARMVEEAMAKGMDCILTTCCLSVRAVDFYKEIAKRHSQPYTIIKCKGKYGTVHKVPQSVLQSMASKWEDHPEEMSVEDYLFITKAEPHYRILPKTH